MISLLRLVDGTEILGRVHTQKDDAVMVEDPMQINYKMRTDSIVPVISMLRFMPFSSEHKVTINKHHIVSYTSPMDGLIKYYDSIIKSLREGEVDRSVNEEFNSAANEELTEEMQIKLAMMEKRSSKATLN